MTGINWVLDSCWRLNDLDEWFNFAIVLLCCPVARAVKKGIGMCFFISAQKRNRLTLGETNDIYRLVVGSGAISYRT
jgi:hypothetical protein